jgi:hypothetical protein
VYRWETNVELAMPMREVEQIAPKAEEKRRVDRQRAHGLASQTEGAHHGADAHCASPTSLDGDTRAEGCRELVFARPPASTCYRSSSSLSLVR